MESSHHQNCLFKTIPITSSGNDLNNLQCNEKELGTGILYLPLAFPKCQANSGRYFLQLTQTLKKKNKKTTKIRRHTQKYQFFHMTINPLEAEQNPEF